MLASQPSTAVEDAVFALKAGEVSAPISTDNAVVVARVAERQDFNPTELQNAREGIRDQAELLQNAFRLPKKCVRDSMLKLDDAVMLEYRLNPDQVLSALQDSVHTRFPVYDGERTRVVGIVNAKDLFAIYATSGLVNLEDAMYPTTWSPAERSITEQLKEFRRARRQMAVVIDDSGTPIGIITLEDIVEELVGDIEDEHDLTARAVR